MYDSLFTLCLNENLIFQQMQYDNNMERDSRTRRRLIECLSDGRLLGVTHRAPKDHYLNFCLRSSDLDLCNRAASWRSPRWRSFLVSVLGW